MTLNEIYEGGFVESFAHTSAFMGRLHPLYLLTFILIGFFAYSLRKRKVKDVQPFWSWMFPAAFYKHSSTMLDFQLFLLGRFIGWTQFLSKAVVTAFFAAVVMVFVSQVLHSDVGERALSYSEIILMTVMIFVVSDFCVYWVHRTHHDRQILWPFHSVHHSAETMTPLTVYRKHPVYDLLSDLFKGLLMGTVQGLCIAVFFGEVEIALIAGVNMFYFAFNIIGSNFRHSHIWISYGRYLEHLFISPAQHQIHHSLKPEHHDKNFGEVLAIWDWMFGTLFVAGKEEVLEFGIARPGLSGERITQPHPTFKAALVKPFQDSFKAYKKHKKQDHIS